MYDPHDFVSLVICNESQAERFIERLARLLESDSGRHALDAHIAKLAALVDKVNPTINHTRR